ncbi:MAG: hypothetical protein WCW84_10060 [Sulfurimonas sp.]
MKKTSEFRDGNEDQASSGISVYHPEGFGYSKPNGYDCTKETFMFGSYLSAKDGDMEIENTIEALKENNRKLSVLRGRPTISYMTSVDRKCVHQDDLSINDQDLKGLVHIVNLIPANVHEIDIIIHSHGGYMTSARRIAEYFRNRFEKVNYLIPFVAYSAAAMMTISGDEIVMTPESCLGPFDVQMNSYDSKGTYLPVREMKEYLRGAIRASAPINFLESKTLYDGLTGATIKKGLHECNVAQKLSKSYPHYWLMKYKFKAHVGRSYKFTNNFIFPWWLFFTKDGRKVARIVNFFTDSSIHISHNNPIMFHDVKDIGLNIKKADGELCELLRETYRLADRLFETSTITKLYLSKDSYTFRFIQGGEVN